MKRFVRVEHHVGGRTLTKRYPARSVGDHLPNNAAQTSDEVYRSCGYFICAYGDYVDRYKPVAPPPPADVLPEGWETLGGGNIHHESGAIVQRRNTADALNGTWNWFPPGEWNCYDPKATLAEAMAAALASVQPAESALRPGWKALVGADGGRARGSRP
jgi:hypothetical protein